MYCRRPISLLPPYPLPSLPSPHFVKGPFCGEFPAAVSSTASTLPETPGFSGKFSELPWKIASEFADFRLHVIDGEKGIEWRANW
mmetsp:Transcript_8812/g.16664  ORF Transcript_8812/g.16664 Transcript_8812/m.16664 type:complete len:85 (+) Transcript_8812:79-333(+)